MTEKSTITRNKTEELNMEKLDLDIEMCQLKIKTLKNELKQLRLTRRSWVKDIKR